MIQAVKKQRLTINYYLEKNKARQIIFNLMEKKKVTEMYQKSLLNLVDLVKEIKL